jgi:hypothetical protein
MRRRVAVARAVALAAVLSATLAGCGGSGSAPSATPSASARPAPHLARFLALPVATPGACPRGTNATTIGRSSPWAGTIDASVFVRPKAPARRVRLLGEQIRRDPLVRTTYFESSSQAFAEFQRLYTCWSSVSRSQTPASYRLVLVPTATAADRDQLVRRLISQPDVESVSCAPGLPCTTPTREPTPQGTPSSP